MDTKNDKVSIPLNVNVPPPAWVSSAYFANNLLVSRCGSIIYNRYNAQDLRTLRSTAESWAEEEDTVAAMENLLRTLKEMSEAE
jgi:hypothetical protein